MQTCGGRRTRYQPVAVSIRPQSLANLVSARTRGDGSSPAERGRATTVGNLRPMRSDLCPQLRDAQLATPAVATRTGEVSDAATVIGGQAPGRTVGDTGRITSDETDVLPWETDP